MGGDTGFGRAPLIATCDAAGVGTVLVNALTHRKGVRQSRPSLWTAVMGAALAWCTFLFAAVMAATSLGFGRPAASLSPCFRPGDQPGRLTSQLPGAGHS